LLRRSLVSLGHPVEKMKRVKVANLELADLPEGRYRHLEAKEIAGLERALSRAGKVAGQSKPRHAR
jgi:16S rRNA U516 pseudouridylate synthase RsuA-like enzyme